MFLSRNKKNITIFHLKIISLTAAKNRNMSRVVRKPDKCICENKDADQLRGNSEADQRLCFRYIDSTIPLVPKYEISILQPSSVVVQPGLCRTWSETPEDRFSHNEAHIMHRHVIVMGRSH